MITRLSILSEKCNWRTTCLFLVLSWVGILCVFRGAIWGDAILAPLDIPPTLFSKYDWVDVDLENIPRNHYVIDMFDYDLPLTHLAHQSIAQGEFPWWDPYCGGGSPLAAAPHFGFTDPLRLVLFRLFPFVTAYNWSRILQSFLGGFGMFLLLRSMGFRPFASVLGALSFQFSASQAHFYYTVPTHSWYLFPYLWLILHNYARTRAALVIGLGGCLCAWMIAAGTLQSHVFTVLFLFAFLAGYGAEYRRDIPRLVVVVGSTFALGCLIAAPILLPQVELFVFGDRGVPGGGFGKHLLTGVISLSGVFPWFTGSFRTLDLGKIAGQPSPAFVVYIGTAALIVAVVGLLAFRKLPPERRPQAAAAGLLLIGYLIGICSTPLINALYTRASILALLGLAVLFALGWETLMTDTSPRPQRIVRSIVVIISVGVMLTHLFAFAVYPRVKDKVLKVVLEKDAHNRVMPSVPELRRFQVNNLPNEITFKNPEVLLAFLGALALLGVSSTSLRKRNVFAIAVFALNLLPLILFAHRGTPYSPLRHWHALLEGGPEQKALTRLLGQDLRMNETPSSRLDRVLPGNTAALYKVHSLYGWPSMGLTGPGQGGTTRDFNVFCTNAPGSKQGEIILLHTNRARYVWAQPTSREVTIARETPNSIALTIAAGAPGELVRTDTYYPGWHVKSPAGIAQRRNADGFWAFSIPGEATSLVLRYRPSYSQLTTPASLIALSVAAGLIVLGSRNRRQAEQVRPA